MEKFTKKETNVCKGVAICIMLFHHLFFRQDSWPLYYYKIQIRSKPLIGFIATQGKICVAIFVLLSAYGLTFSMNKCRQKIAGGQSKLKGYVSFIGTHILNLYKLYWPVFIPAMLIGFVTDLSNPIKVYKSIGEGIRDFFGVAYIFDGETPFNGAWWYISFAITLYMAFPLLYKAVKKYPKILLFLSFLIGINPVADVMILLEWRRYLFICCLGIYFANNNMLSKLISWKSKKIRIIVTGSMSIILLAIRCIKSFTFDGFLATVIIVLSITLFNNTKYLSVAIGSLGRYSGTMFLLHGLLYKNFMRDFIYGFKYPILIFAALLIASYLCSVIVQSATMYICSCVCTKTIEKIRTK